MKLKTRTLARAEDKFKKQGTSTFASLIIHTKATPIVISGLK